MGRYTNIRIDCNIVDNINKQIDYNKANNIGNQTFKEMVLKRLCDVNFVDSEPTEYQQNITRYKKSLESVYFTDEVYINMFDELLYNVRNNLPYTTISKVVNARLFKTMFTEPVKTI